MKTIVSQFVVVLMVCIWTGVHAASEPIRCPDNRLEEPILAEADGQRIIDVAGGHSAPFCVDWDGDGKMDLLLGSGTDVRLRIYRNQGQLGAPIFGAYSHFEAAGEPATVPAGYG